MKKCLLVVAALAAVALMAPQASAQEAIQAPGAVVSAGPVPMVQTVTPVRSGLFGRRVRYVVTETPVMPVTVAKTMPTEPMAATTPAPVVATPIVETRGMRGRLFMRRAY